MENITVTQEMLQVFVGKILSLSLSENGNPTGFTSGKIAIDKNKHATLNLRVTVVKEKTAAEKALANLQRAQKKAAAFGIK